jgi:hypothetical protein
MEPTPGTPAPTTAPDPGETILKDALRGAIGKAPSRIARGIVTLLGAVATAKGFGWINPNDPTTNLVIAAASGVLVNGAMAYARERWGARPDLIGTIVRWLPA